MTADFVKESRIQIARLKNDLRYRYLLEKEAKELADQKAAEKAKNKKKWKINNHYSANINNNFPIFQS